MEKNEIPGEFLEILEDKVSILCNIGTLNNPWLQERIFAKAPLKEIVKDFPEYPVQKYCMITTETEPGKLLITFEEIDASKFPEFHKNFIKPDYFKDVDTSFLTETQN